MLKPAVRRAQTSESDNSLSPLAIGMLPYLSDLRQAGAMLADRTYHAKEREMEKTALITGITGQDGSYLAELLLSKGYKVYGLIRRASTDNCQRLEHLSLIHI